MKSDSLGLRSRHQDIGLNAPGLLACLFLYLFIYLAASGLHCIMQDLSLLCTDSLVVVSGLSFPTSGGARISDIVRWVLSHWASREVPHSPGLELLS